MTLPVSEKGMSRAVRGLLSAALQAGLLGSAAAQTPPALPDSAASKIARLQSLLSKSPDNGSVMYRLAVVCAQNGEGDRAVAWLEKAVALGSDFDLANDPGLASLRNLAAFRQLEARTRQAPAHTSRIAFRIAEPDLIPEGIAWDPVTKSFFVGSLYKRKIVRLGPDGSAHDFVASGRDGLWTVLGLKVDPERRILWVNTAADNREGEAAGSSGLFAFDLPTGRLLEKHILDGGTQKHLFNDLVVTSRGEIFLTDRESGAIYRRALRGRALEAFLPPGSFSYPNGIALDEARKRLYVADFARAITIVEIDTKKTIPLAHPQNMSLHQIDGLYRYEASLVGIQNGVGMERVSQFQLDDTGCRVESLRVLESHNPQFRIPTTGAIVGNDFYYLANSQLESLGDDGQLAPGARLDDVLILKTPLN
jgi:sugar lactone lactonase YvrE